MTKYKLLKDLPWMKKWGIFTFNIDWYDSSSICLWTHIVENNKEWFEEIKEVKSIYNLKEWYEYFYIDNYVYDVQLKQC